MSDKTNNRPPHSASDAVFEEESRITGSPAAGSGVPQTSIASTRPPHPKKLYGRQLETAMLIDSFKRVATLGEPETLFIAGPSGVGKSSLVHELKKLVGSQDGLFATGKFDRDRRDIPYATLAQAIGDALEQLCARRDTAIDRLRNPLRDAIAANAPAMLDLVPQLIPLTGQTPSGVIPAPGDAKVLTYRAFEDTLRVICDQASPLVLFVDDLQWLDSATLDLLLFLVCEAQVRNLLLVGAYRSNEVGPGDPLTQVIAKMKNSGSKVRELGVANLARSDIRNLVADLLSSSKENARELSDFVYAKAKGSPFFTLQLLGAISDDGGLVFQPDRAAWVWDINKITARGYSGNVVDLMVAKLDRLSAWSRTLLVDLACLGNNTSAETLETVSGRPTDEIEAELQTAVSMGILRLQGNRYFFEHDRLHEAVYHLLPQERREREHLRIGQALIAGDGEAGEDHRVFDVVGQFNRALSLITDRNERWRVAELNLSAALRAKQSAAYTSARAYLSVGCSLLEAEDWASKHQLAHDLLLELAACDLLCGDLAAAEFHIAELLPRADSKVEKAAAYRLRIELHLRRSESPAAVATALECLALFSIHISAHPTQTELEAAFVEVWDQLDNRPAEALIALPLADDPEFEAAMQVLVALYEPAVFTDERLVGAHLCQMIVLTLAKGISPASAHAFGLFGFTIGHYFGRYEDGYVFCQVARSLVQRHKFLAYEAKTLYALELASVWTRPLDVAIEASDKAFAAAVKIGDAPYSCYAFQHSLTDRLARGDNLQELDGRIDAGIAFIGKTTFDMVLEVLIAQKRFVQALQIGRDPRGIFSDEGFDEFEFEARFNTEQAPTGVFWHWIIKAQALFIYGDFRTAVEILDRARPLIWSSIGHIQTADFHVFSALSMAALHADLPVDRMEQFTTHIGWLARWSEASPATFGSRYALLRAEQARLERRDSDAERLFDEAIRLAGANDLIHDRAIANETAARFYAERGAERTAQIYLREAKACYSKWGAKGKVRELDNNIPPAFKTDEGSAIEHALTSSTDIDLAAIFGVSRAVMDEVDIDRLLERLLSVISNTAGATRGILASFRQEQVWIDLELASEPREAFKRQFPAKDGDVPASIVRHVARTFESIILEDALLPSGFSADPYLRSHQPRSVLALPLIRQARLVGVLYLEESSVPNKFDPRRAAMLQFLASQAATSLENARLFSEARQAEARFEHRELELRVANDSLPALTWVSDGEGNNAEFNQPWYDYTGLTPEEARAGGWKYCFHPDDRQASVEQWHLITTKRIVGETEARIRRHDGEYRWFLVRASPFFDSTGKMIRCYGTESDIDDLKRAEAMLAGEKKLFEMIATNQPLAAILDTLCITIGELGRQPLASILLMSEDGQSLRTGAAPNLATGYSAAINGIRIGPTSGSCGTAAFRREAVQVNDIANDPLWADHRDIALQYGLRACWSTPIMSTTGNVLGTIAIYSERVREITQRELEVMDRFTHLASIVIERKQADEALQTSEALLAEGQRISQTGSWSWSLGTSKLRCSDELRRIFGFALNDFELSFKDFARQIHIEDRGPAMRTIESAARHGRAFEHDFRIVLTDGSTRFMHGSGRAVVDPSNRVAGFFGAVTDITVQRLAAIELEAALRRTQQSEDRQRTLIDMIPCHAWVSDPVTGGEFFSRQWLDYVGLTLDAVRGTGWRKSLHPDDLARHVEVFSRTMEEKAVGKVESRLRRYDGAYRWFLFTAQPLLDDQGEVVKWYGTNIDIDDLKRAETLLEAEKQLFKMIATGDPLDSILIELCRIVEALADGAIASIMLIDEEGKRLRHRASISIPEAFRQAIDDCAIGPLGGACGAAVYLGERVSSADIASDPLWADLGPVAVNCGLLSCTSTPILASDGRVLGAFAAYSRTAGVTSPATLRLVDQFTDLASIVIERKRAEEALRKSEAFLAEGQRISQTGSWAWAIGSGKLLWSEEHARIFGYDLEENGGRLEDMLARMLPAEREFLGGILKSSMEAKSDIHVEYQATLPNGQVKQLLCTGRPVLNASGELVEYVGTTMDITERKRVEDELQKSEEHLRQVQAELAHVARTTTMGELAASIAHEVNQPLTGIITGGGAALRWLSRSTPNVERATESIKNVVNEGKRASDVIVRIRKMLRKELAPREELDLRELVGDVVFLTRSEMQRYDVTFKLNVPPELPPILGDRVQLQQVLMNLFLNAIEAMKDLEAPPRTMSIEAFVEGADFLRVVVSDTGPSIAREDADKVFQPFYTSKAGGLGMGLSICRSIIEGHGGELNLVMDRGKGCWIEFTVPTASEDVGARQRADV